jgi:vacuolar-type H+-ATPase subunit I/STV1
MILDQEGGVSDSKNDVAGGEGQEKRDQVSYDTYQKLLSQRKKDQERLNALEKERQELLDRTKQEEESKLNEKGEFKKIIELRESKISELAEKIAMLEANANGLQNELITRKKLEAFISKLPARLVDREYLKLVDFDEIIVDPDSKEIDERSLETLVGTFVKKHGRLLETKKTNMPNEAATGSTKIEYDAWLKLPFKEQKKYSWDDLKNIPK